MLKKYFHQIVSSLVVLFDFHRSIDFANEDVRGNKTDGTRQNPKGQADQ